jgi:protein SCO1
MHRVVLRRLSAARLGARQFSSGGGNDAKSLGHSKRGPVTMLSLGLASISLGGILWYYKLEKEKKTERVASQVTTTGKAALGGPWVLVDQDGIPRTDASYKGKYQILYFGFSFCPDICPSELVKIGKVIDILTEKGIDVTPLFITVDPPRDTIQQLKNYSQDFHSKIQYLTGTKEQVGKACKAYRVYFSKANENEDDDEDYLVDHSIVFYLLDDKGEFQDFFTQRMQVGDIVTKIVENMNKKNE